MNQTVWMRPRDHSLSFSGGEVEENLVFGVTPVAGEMFLMTKRMLVLKREILHWIQQTFHHRADLEWVVLWRVPELVGEQLNPQAGKIQTKAKIISLEELGVEIDKLT